MSFEDSDINDWVVVGIAFGTAFQTIRKVALIGLAVLSAASFGLGLHAGLLG